MKRGTPDHPKTLRLQEELQCSRVEAVGLLELLWHYAARYSPRGDVGRWTNKQIATGVHWQGDPDALIAALLAAGWLEERPGLRLLIHDWHEHADEAVKKALSRAGLTFAVKSRRRRDAVATESRPPEPCQSPALPEPVLGAAHRKRRIPSDFTLTAERSAYAETCGILDRKAEFEKFKLHHQAKGTKHEDWHAAWQYWCRRSRDFKANHQRVERPPPRAAPLPFVGALAMVNGSGTDEERQRSALREQARRLAT